MSRIGKKPIALQKATVEINGDHIVVKGPNGQLERDIPNLISVAVEDNQIQVTRANDSKQARSLHGLVRSLVANMVEGVSNSYTKTLELVGVGYRASVAGNTLTLNVGLSHPVEFVAPEGITFEVEKNTTVRVKGIDKEVVGNLAANIRAIRKPEPYKGKGIKYAGEVIRRKAGKAK